MADDQVNEYGTRVWKDSKGVWRKIGDDGKRTSQFASAPLSERPAPKAEALPPVKPAPEVPAPAPLLRSVPKDRNRSAAPVWVFSLLLLVGVGMLGYYFWPQIKSLLDTNQQTVEQSAPMPASEPAVSEKVASGNPRDSRCNLDGTVFVNQLGRCVFPPK